MQATVLYDCTNDYEAPCIGGYVFVGLTTLAYTVTLIMVIHSAYNYLYKAKRCFLVPILFYVASLILCILRLVELSLIFTYTPSPTNVDHKCSGQVKL